VKMQVAHASLPKQGETANGDRPFHRQDGPERHLIAVIDGLGHGPEAQLASLAALAYLGEVSLDSPLDEIMPGLHEKMRGTRGAAGAVCIANGNALSACAVGNVEIRPIRADIPLIASAGILGVRVQKFRIARSTFKTPCRLLIFSDGITNPTSVHEFHGLSPEAACKGLMERHRRNYDDATVLIADLE
jgi:negative regulator of sigma-B (phosphoserine phosphatase)